MPPRAPTAVVRAEPRAVWGGAASLYSGNTPLAQASNSFTPMRFFVTDGPCLPVRVPCAARLRRALCPVVLVLLHLNDRFRLSPMYLGHPSSLFSSTHVCECVCLVRARSHLHTLTSAHAPFPHPSAASPGVSVSSLPLGELICPLLPPRHFPPSLLLPPAPPSLPRPVTPWVSA